MARALGQASEGADQTLDILVRKNAAEGENIALRDAQPVREFGPSVVAGRRARRRCVRHDKYLRPVNAQVFYDFARAELADSYYRVGNAAARPHQDLERRPPGAGYAGGNRPSIAVVNGNH